MTGSGTATTPSGADAGTLAERVRKEIADLDREVAEVEMLIAQARTEAGRHEARRAAAVEKASGAPPDAKASDVAELHAQVATLTKRAAIMEAQVDVLEGKRRALQRHRTALDTIGAELAGLGAPAGTDPSNGASAGSDVSDAAHATGRARGGGGSGDEADGRTVLAAQEELRREIARAMHDGPAQSLTNIVLQAAIVDRLIGRDDDGARAELRLLSSMVEQTLEATKAFIFDVRPMVLDDLGLVPTLRRAARDRGGRARIPVGFESVGQDRRLATDVESGLFRIADEALAAFLAASPDRVAIRLEWSDGSVALDVRSERAAPADTSPEEPPAAADVPPALAAMIEDRRAAKRAARDAAIVANLVVLPPELAARLVERAQAVGGEAEVLEHGSELRVTLRDAPSAPAG